MSFEPDVANDCLLVDGTETVTLHSASVVSVEGAKRGPLTLAEMEFRQLGLESSDLAWNLPGVNLDGVEPRQGDAIEDASGTLWTILSVAESPLTRVWRAVTRRQL
jgi:hypothetical protein